MLLIISRIEEQLGALDMRNLDSLQTPEGVDPLEYWKNRLGIYIFSLALVIKIALKKIAL